MTLQTEAEETTRVSYDLFFKGPEGYGEHLQVISPDSRRIIDGRPKLLDWLKQIGATPLPRDIAFPGKAPFAPGAPAKDPMMQAAQAVLGASIGRTCSIHNVAMKRVAGTQETGKLSKNGKSYPSFWVCEAVEGCRGGE